MVAAVITELSSNILQHAESGEIAIEIVEIAGRQAIVIRAKDQGPGIPSVKEALESSFSVAAGMGIGLRGVRALVDRLEIISFPGRGTTVTAQIWRS
jgi:serine/threonine-protein kinase RsbT